MMTKIGTEVAPVTRESDTIFKVKRAKVKVTRPLRRPQKGGEGQGHIVAAARLQLVNYNSIAQVLHCSLFACAMCALRTVVC